MTPVILISIVGFLGLAWCLGLGFLDRKDKREKDENVEGSRVLLRGCNWLIS